MPKYIRMRVDSDFAADRRTRRSTTGMVQRLGAHCVKATANLQASAGLNVGETEYYALVHGAVHGLGLQSYLRDWGLHFDLVIESDSTRAKSFASWQGLGKQRHVQTRYLGAGTDRKEGVRYPESRRRQEYFRYTHQGHSKPASA